MYCMVQRQRAVAGRLELRAPTGDASCTQRTLLSRSSVALLGNARCRNEPNREEARALYDDVVPLQGSLALATG